MPRKADNLPPGFTMDASATPNNPYDRNLPPDKVLPEDFLPAKEPGEKDVTPGVATPQSVGEGVQRPIGPLTPHEPGMPSSFAPPPLPVAAPPPPTGGVAQPPAPATQAANPPPAAPQGVPEGFTLDVKPHYETPDQLASAFDYNNSILKQAVPEHVARSIVKAVAIAHDGYTSFADSAADKALYFLNEHARDAIMTYRPGIGDAEWQNKIAEYQAQKRGTEAAHPELARAGTGLTYAAAASGGYLAAEAGVTLGAAAKVAQNAAKLAWPIIARAATSKWAQAAIGGTAAGAAYGFGKRLGDKFFGEVSK